MSSSERRRVLRQILQGENCLIASSVFDPISARIADLLGAQVSVVGGSIVSLAVLGAPDLALVGLAELTEQVARICRTSRHCVLVDADHGFGNALNVMRTVESMEMAGASAVMIEDARLPLPYGEVERPGLISSGEAVGKIRAAVRARTDPDFVLIARTNAIQSGGIADALERLQALEEAGADALFLPHIVERRHLEQIARTVQKPLILGSPGEALRTDIPFMASQGVRICLQGHQPYEEATRALFQAMAKQRGEEATPIPEDLMNRVSKNELYQQLVAEFLGSAPTTDK